MDFGSGAGARVGVGVPAWGAWGAWGRFFGAVGVHFLRFFWCPGAFFLRFFCAFLGATTRAEVRGGGPANVWAG